MSYDVEEMLGDDLRRVADGVHVPPVPSWATDEGPARDLPLVVRPAPGPRSQHHLPLLAAAAAVVLLVGATWALSTWGPERDPAPAPRPDHGVQQPRVPHVVDQQLYVDGRVVPGAWRFVATGGETWVAQRSDRTWRWGTDGTPQPLDDSFGQEVVVSPAGRYVAHVATIRGASQIALLDPDSLLTVFSGVEAPRLVGGPDPFVVAVSESGEVVVSDGKDQSLWRPDARNDLVDLSVTAPGWEVVGALADGLVARRADDRSPHPGTAHVVRITDDGEVRPLHELPYGDWMVGSPDGARVAFADPDFIGGEVTHLRELWTAEVDTGRTSTVRAPEGWEFVPCAWTWEDDSRFVAQAVAVRAGRDRTGPQTMVRCDADEGECWLIDPEEADRR